MECKGIKTTEGYIPCDSISKIGDNLPGFYSIWCDGERCNVINGAFIIEVVEGERDPNYCPITVISFD